MILSSDRGDDIKLLGEGRNDYAVSIDKGPYVISETWTFLNKQDLYLVSLRDGSRKNICKGLSGFVNVSPGGHYVIWSDLDKGAFFSFRVSDGVTRCLTDGLGVNFFDEDNDRPHKPFPYCTLFAWTDDDESVLISDRYDIWQIRLDNGAALNLTDGYGRKNKIRFRYARLGADGLTDEEKMLDVQQGVTVGDRLVLTAYDEGRILNGYALIKAGVSKEPSVYLDTMSFTGAVKSSGSDVVAFQKGSFSVPEDLYITQDYWQTARKVYQINPQQKEFSWGTARKVEWNAYDGTPMRGILYVPEGVKTKCPMIVYFYERRSETLRDYIEPDFSRSRINISFMCSNGYAVFEPDVIFKTGHPGESAFNCIVSGTEAVCKEFPFIDRDNIGIQGRAGEDI